MIYFTIPAKKQLKEVFSKHRSTINCQTMSTEMQPYRGMVIWRRKAMFMRRIIIKRDLTTIVLDLLDS